MTPVSHPASSLALFCTNKSIRPLPGHSLLTSSSRTQQQVTCQNSHAWRSLLTSHRRIRAVCPLRHSFGIADGDGRIPLRRCLSCPPTYPVCVSVIAVHAERALDYPTAFWEKRGGRRGGAELKPKQHAVTIKRRCHWVNCL